ncbi:hypothetical protein [Azotobacter armeniacus]
MLVVGLAYCEQLDNPAWALSSLFATLLLGQLSHALIKVPARLAQVAASMGGRRCSAGSPVALVAHAVRLDGFPGRRPAAVGEVEAQTNNRNPRQDECLDKGAACIFGGDLIKALIMGDSHADALVTAAQAALFDPQQGLYS